jgi:hypothetical protein
MTFPHARFLSALTAIASCSETSRRIFVNHKIEWKKMGSNGGQEGTSQMADFMK